MSKVEVNEIDKQSGSTLTLGGSGTAVTLACGATQTGFGRNGAVDWQTTVKTSTFTASAGEGYFVDTSSGSGFNVNLPAGVAGAIVGFKDYAGTFNTKNLTLVPNGSDKIGGIAGNAPLNDKGLAVTLVFIDSTKGWLVTDSGLQDEAASAQFVTATGGTITTVCTNFKVHTFTGPGTFCVSCGGNSQGSNSVDYVVVAGGGGGGEVLGGGGGAGGYRESPGTTTCYTASPLGASPAAAIPVSVTGFPITVGGGGAESTVGNNSSFSSITSIGGGLGRSGPGAQPSGGDGGSGGGSNGYSPTGTAGGSGNTPSVSPPQGNNGGRGGGAGPGYPGGGGGGATTAGGFGPTPNSAGGAGGTGATTNITGAPKAFAGGGGGGVYTSGSTGGAGGTGGGGGGGADAPSAGGAGGTGYANGTAGTPSPEGTGPSGGGNGGANSGGGAGGAGFGGGAGPSLGGTGGSGVVIIRYKFQ